MTAVGRRYTPFKIEHKYIRAHTTFTDAYRFHI